MGGHSGEAVAFEAFVLITVVSLVPSYGYFALNRVTRAARQSWVHENFGPCVGHRGTARVSLQLVNHQVPQAQH